MRNIRMGRYTDLQDIYITGGSKRLLEIMLRDELPFPLDMYDLVDINDRTPATTNFPSSQQNKERSYSHTLFIVDTLIYKEFNTVFVIHYAA